MESVSERVLIAICSANFVFNAIIIIILMKYFNKKKDPDVPAPQKESTDTQTSAVMIYSASAESSVPTVLESSYSLKKSSKFGIPKKNLSASLIFSGRGRSSSSETILRRCSLVSLVLFWFLSAETKML